MKARCALILNVLFVSVLSFAGCNGSAAVDDEVAVLETGYGRIVIEFFGQDAPKHVANFKELTREGFYDGTKFHRVVRGGGRFVAVQGGDPNTISGDPATWGQGQPNQKTVPAEFSKTLKHVRGIVSAARRNDPDSATSQFFICTSEATQWDEKYSIFGRVIEGIEVVDLIVRAPVWEKTERPMDPVAINRAYLVKRADLKPAN